MLQINFSFHNKFKNTKIYKIKPLMYTMDLIKVQKMLLFKSNSKIVSNFDLLIVGNNFEYICT